MNWFLLAGLAGIASNGFNILNRIALKDNGDATAYAWWFELIRTLFFFLIISIARPHLTLGSLFPLTLVSLAELFSVYLFMKMHALTHLSISSIISRMRVIWSPLVAWLLIGEQLTLTEYLGIGVIFSGIAIVTGPKEIKQDRGVKIAILFSLSSALLSTLIKNSTNTASTETIIVAQGLVSLLILPLLMRNSFARLINSAQKKLKQILSASAFNIASSYLLVEAMRQTSASKVIGVYQAMTLLSVLYGIVILQEKDKYILKIIGALLVIGGVYSVSIK